MKRRLVILAAFLAASVVATLGTQAIRAVSMGEKRVHVVEPGRVIRGAWQTPVRIAVDHRPRADQDDRHAHGDQSRRSEVRGAGGRGRGDGCKLGFCADAGFSSDAGPDG